jgi:VanZ family protein
LSRRESALVVTLVLVAIVLFGRLVVIGKTQNVSELAALAACLPLGAVLVARRERGRVATLVALLIAAIFVQGVAPFELLPQAQGFSWIPFRSSLSGSVELNYAALLEKCFWYFSLVWLLVRSGASTRAATFGTAAFVALIEIAQMWLPGRSADVTDPLLVLAAGLLLAMRREGFGLAPEPLALNSRR